MVTKKTATKTPVKTARKTAVKTTGVKANVIVGKEDETVRRAAKTNPRSQVGAGVKAFAKGLLEETKLSGAKAPKIPNSGLSGAHVADPTMPQLDPLPVLAHYHLNRYRLQLESMAAGGHFAINSSLIVDGDGQPKLRVWVDSPFTPGQTVFDVRMKHEDEKLRASVLDIVAGRLVTELFPPSLSKVVGEGGKTVIIHHWTRHKTMPVNGNSVATRYFWQGCDHLGNALITVYDGTIRSETPKGGRVTFLREVEQIRVFNSWAMPQLPDAKSLTAAVRQAVAKKAAKKTVAKKSVAKKVVAKKTVRK